MHPCDMPRVSMSHIAHVEKSCHTHKWVMLHARMSPVQLETRRTHQWVMSHMKMSHVIRVNESRGTHALVTAHSQTHTQSTNQPAEQQRIKYGTHLTCEWGIDMTYDWVIPATHSYASLWRILPQEQQRIKYGTQLTYEWGIDMTYEWVIPVTHSYVSLRLILT